jgi:histone H3/H4
MNALELADYITENSYIGTVTMEDVATMLRQQQAEIEALKADTIPYKDLHRVVKNVLAHPVKELTIEEIEEVSKEIFKGYKNFYHYQINFARAILRKAQEK